MTISIQNEKLNRITLKIRNFLTYPTHSIRHLVSIIGSVISIFSSNIYWKFVKLQYITIVKEKILRKIAGNFEEKKKRSNKEIRSLCLRFLLWSK